MGNLFSQETDNVIVKVKPYYFTRSEDGYSQDKIKNFKITKNITLKKDDKDYLFNVCKYSIKKTSFKGTELIFDIQYCFKEQAQDLFIYLKMPEKGYE